MKKFGLIMATVAILAFVGCASSGGGSSGGPTAAPFNIDLSTLTPTDVSGNPIAPKGTLMNPNPFTKNYDDFMLMFDKSALPTKWSDYSRVTITAKCYNENKEQIADADGNMMVSFVYDISKDIRGPDMGPGPNTPLKEMNIGGYSGVVNKPRGVRSRVDKPLDAILFQNSNAGVKYIEVTGISFHNGD